MPSRRSWAADSRPTSCALASASAARPASSSAKRGVGGAEAPARAPDAERRARRASGRAPRAARPSSSAARTARAAGGPRARRRSRSTVRLVQVRRSAAPRRASTSRGARERAGRARQRALEQPRLDLRGVVADRPAWRAGAARRPAPTTSIQAASPRSGTSRRDEAPQRVLDVGGAVGDLRGLGQQPQLAALGLGGVALARRPRGDRRAGRDDGQRHEALLAEVAVPGGLTQHAAPRPRARRAADVARRRRAPRATSTGSR